MTHGREGPRKFRDGILILAALAASGVFFMWIWNVLGHDLLGGPAAQYRHGLAAACAYMLLHVLARPGRRAIGGRRDMPQREAVQ